MSAAPFAPHDVLARNLLQTLAAAQARNGTPLPAAAEAALARTLPRLFAAVADGDTCVALADCVDPGAELPARVRELATALADSGVVARARYDLAALLPATPLVLDDRDRLFLRRHFAAEREVAAFFATAGRTAVDVRRGTVAYLEDVVRAEPSDAWQKAAVAAAVSRRVAVVTGGPGTGKTTTILRVLAALLAGDGELRIALAAPTGKAAARMDAARASLQKTQPTAEVAPATTLHRLLGFLPTSESFRRGPDSPLPFDVVVVDEASMIDLELVQTLLRALRPDARLILLGDRDQLASIGAGQVLFDLCAAARPENGAAAELAERCRTWFGLDLPVAAAPSPLAASVVQLRKTFRFAADSGIGAFARAVAAREPEAAMEALTRGRADLALTKPHSLAAVLEPWIARCAEACRATSPTDALARLLHQRILCAQHQGPFGKEAANAFVEARLRRLALAPDASYRGKPVLVTANDHRTGLVNGDLGVLWPDADGRLLAWFPGPDGGEPRSVPPLRLPPHETAWAMTVHKSQGSEFDEVLVLLPERDHALLDAPLVYTAVTRARRQAHVVGDPEVVRAALGRPAGRRSGLQDWLA